MQKEDIDNPVPNAASTDAATDPQAEEVSAAADAEDNSQSSASPLDDAGGIDMGALPDAAQLAAELEAARAEAEKWRDQAMRATAESQNFRARAERDVEKAHKFGLEKFAEALLPVHDSLVQALAVQYPAEVEAHMAPMREGIELTLKMLLDTLSRFNVESVDPAGEPFNPQFHEAMTAVENPDCEPNTVIDVFQKGFTLNGRLVRAAKVVVSRAPVTPVNEQA